MRRKDYIKVTKEIEKAMLRQKISACRFNRYHLILQELESLKVNLRSPTDRDIDKYYFHLQNQALMEWTKYTNWAMFKRILKLLHPERNFQFFRWKHKRPITEIEPLTRQEIRRIYLATDNLRDRAIIAIFYEGALRTGELLSMRKSNIRYDKYGLRAIVYGKTGNRSIRLTKASPIIKVYASLVQGDKLFAIRREAVERVVKEAAKKAGVKKRVWPTLFRHMDITESSRYLTEAEQRLVYGWSKSSKMPSHYNHLSGRDIDDIVIPLRFRCSKLNLSIMSS